MSQHDRLEIDPGVQVCFCGEQSHNSVANERINGPPRQCFSKGANLSIRSAEIAVAAQAPMHYKNVGLNAPAETLDALLP